MPLVHNACGNYDRPLKACKTYNIHIKSSNVIFKDPRSFPGSYSTVLDHFWDTFGTLSGHLLTPLGRSPGVPGRSLSQRVSRKCPEAVSQSKPNSYK